MPAANVTKQAPVESTSEPSARPGPSQVILLRAAEDADVVDELMGAIQDAAQSVRFAGTSVARLADARDIDPRALVVPCVSEGFLRTAGSADAVAHARGGQPVMPVYLAPVDPATNTLADLPAFDGGTALSEWPSLEQWLPVLGREIALQAQLDPAGPRSYLPRFSADSLEGKDLLERQSKIDFLGSVLSAKNLETPLAIGLFGNWGSGKSFFMRRLQEQIVELTEASAQAAKDGKETLYCSHIRHVTVQRVAPRGHRGHLARVRRRGLPRRRGARAGDAAGADSAAGAPPVPGAAQAGVRARRPRISRARSGSASSSSRWPRSATRSGGSSRRRRRGGSSSRRCPRSSGAFVIRGSSGSRIADLLLLACC